MTISEAKKYIISELELYSDYATFEAAEILIYATETDRAKLLFSAKEKIGKTELFKIKSVYRVVCDDRKPFARCDVTAQGFEIIHYACPYQNGGGI